jgi:aryl-alcohol dehydrogenase-like predicted oxidoreductase
MRFRRLGRTGLVVSECTIGTMGFAAGPDLREAGAAVALALERGANALETGAEAEVIGEILRREDAGNRVHVFARVTSLVPFDLPSPHVPAGRAYPGRHIRAETEALLATLGVERLALQQLHAWCPEWLHEGDWLETLHALRDEGKIAGIGVSIFDHDAESALEAAASGAIDCVQVMYNIFDPSAAAALLPLCQKHDVGVIARAPLYYGALSEAGVGDPAPGDWRRDYFFDEHRRETGERVDQVVQLVEPPDNSVSDMALRFALSHPAVSTAAVGMTTRDHVQANLDAIARGALNDAKLAQLGEHRWLC